MTREEFIKMLEDNNRFDWKTLFFYQRTYELHRIADALEALVEQKRNQK